MGLAISVSAVETQSTVFGLNGVIRSNRMKKAAVILCLLLAAKFQAPNCANGCIKASDWPCYRGPSADAIVTDPELLTDWPQDGLKVLWTVSFHDEQQNTHAGPAIVAGKVYVPCKSGEKDVVVCFDAQTGRELWKYSYDAPVHDEVYGTGIRACPTVYKQVVYTLGCYGQLICLDKDSGQLVWRRNLIEDFKGRVPSFGASAAPTIIDDMLICEPGGMDASVVALDPLSGKEIWRSGSDEASYAAPEVATICGVRQLLTFLSPGLVAFDLKTGKPLWRYEFLDERRKNIPAPIVVGDTVYVCNNTLGFAAIKVEHLQDNWTVSKVWSARREKMHYSSPVLGNGCIYYHNSKREIKALSLVNGDVGWTASNMGTQFGMLIRLNDAHLLGALDDGEIVLLEVSPSSFKEKARFKPLEKAFLQPAVADGKLFVRDHEKLICFNLSKQAPTLAAAASPEANTIKTKVIPAQNSSEKPLSQKLGSFVKINLLRYLVGWLAALSLAVLGVLISRPNRVFTATAVPAVATFGSILAMWIRGAISPDHWKWFQTNRFLTAMPVIFALIAAAVAAMSGRHRGKAAMFSILATVLGISFLSHTQMATVDPFYIISSADIASTRSAAWEFTTILLLTAALIFGAYRRGLRGIPVDGFNFSKTEKAILGIWVAITIGYCVRSTGTLYTMVFIICPPYIARSLCRKWDTRFMFAIVAATLGVFGGFALGDILQTSSSYATLFFMLFMTGCVAVWPGQRNAAMLETT